MIFLGAGGCMRRWIDALEWVQHWQASGLTQAEFVRVHQLKCTAFASWMRRSRLESADPLSGHGRFVWPQSKKNKRQGGGAAQWVLKKSPRDERGLFVCCAGGLFANRPLFNQAQFFLRCGRKWMQVR